jgi:transposase
MSDAKPTKEALIIQLAGQGVSRDAICAQLGVGSHRVTNTLKGFKTTGLVPEAPSRGPRKKITKAILDFIDIRTLQRAHLSSAKLAAEIKAKFQVNLHPATVAVKRHLANFHYQPPRHTQELMDYHMKDRRDFVDKMLAHPAWLPKIHFSDESRFVLGDDKRWVWYRRGEYNPSAMRSTRKYPPSVMIFAVIGPNYKSKLLFVEGTINTDKYIQNLEDVGFIKDLDARYGALGWIFMQDGAPCHTSQEALDWIEANCDIIRDWPANSPDLNPIELLWALLKHAVAQLEPETIEDLKHVIQAAWDGINLHVVTKLCEYFPQRLALCKREEGRSISKLLYLCREDDIAHAVVRDHTSLPRPWLPEEEKKVYEFIRTHGLRWAELKETQFPDRTASAIKMHWYSVLLKREQAVLEDTDTMMRIHELVREGVIVPEICQGTGTEETEEPNRRSYFDSMTSDNSTPRFTLKKSRKLINTKSCPQIT